MQIKEFYIDLREGPQYAKNNNNVWLLESEAFKEPLVFKFAFDKEDEKALEKNLKDCQDVYDKIRNKEKEIDNLIEKIEWKESLLTSSYERLNALVDKYDEVINQIKEKEKILKEKELAENDKITGILKEVNMIKEKIDLPEPRKIYSKQWEEFVSWDDTCYGEPFILQPGEYYVLEWYEYEPQNEYVKNKNEVKIKQIYIKDEWYIPEFQLYGENVFDLPVSKVKLFALFFRI